jgi:osmotically inducible lipoprotein OsmB
MKVFTLVLAAASAIVLAGCSTTEQRIGGAAVGAVAAGPVGAAVGAAAAPAIVDPGHSTVP